MMKTLNLEFEPYNEVFAELEVAENVTVEVSAMAEEGSYDRYMEFLRSCERPSYNSGTVVLVNEEELVFEMEEEGKKFQVKCSVENYNTYEW